MTELTIDDFLTLLHNALDKKRQSMEQQHTNSPKKKTTKANNQDVVWVEKYF